MPNRKDGSFYPAASDRKPNRKAQARLNARIAGYETALRGLATNDNPKSITKPGSYKK